MLKLRSELENHWERHQVVIFFQNRYVSTYALLMNRLYVGSYKQKVQREVSEYIEKSEESHHTSCGARNKIFACNESDAERNAADR